MCDINLSFDFNPLDCFLRTSIKRFMNGTKCTSKPIIVQNYLKIKNIGLINVFVNKVSLVIITEVKIGYVVTYYYII